MKSLLLTLFFSLHVFAEPMDNYYSDDLLDAVDQARAKPHHYDYSNTYRYKRTTAQSIQLNQLDLDELDTTRLEINSVKTESYVDNTKHENNNTELKTVNLIDKNTRTHKFPTMPRLTTGSHAKALQGGYRTTGIENSGTMISTPRP